jgi:lipopolysaccharide/colanic/teichoic acid biosynthesis glycosyltransferase
MSRAIDLTAPNDRLKRALDLVGGMTLLIASAPLLGLACLAIRLDSSGPAVFRAARVGRDGHPFTLYKLRTMCVGAEAQLASLSSQNVGGQHFIRIPDDPRVTRVGRVLRKTGLDELPQLVNIVRGDMSLVGPRPQAPNEVRLYDARERQRLAVRPGLTGLWQIRAWDSARFDDWIRYDLEYIGSRNIWLDLRILAETPPVIVKRVVAARRGGE